MGPTESVGRKITRVGQSTHNTIKKVKTYLQHGRKYTQIR